MTIDGSTTPLPSLSPSLSPDDVRRKRRLWILALKVFAVVAGIWLLTAYVILPAVWKHYEHQPGLENAPKWSTTKSGIPGDPLNVGLLGSEESVVRSMLGAGWDPADPVTLRSSLRIARSVVFGKAYPEAPVSDLYLFGHKQDLAFQKAAGKSARRRHHVRFWRSAELGRDGLLLWLGAVTFDSSVGFSRTTGQVTHHIAPDIDAERNGLIQSLIKMGDISELYQVTGVGSTLVGRNGGGDLYYTDGEMTIGVLGANQAPTVARLENPVAVQIKEQFWTAIRPLLQSLPGQ